VRQLKISLPDTLRDQLDAAVAKSGNSLGEEIRQRLERTIEQDASDPITRELASAVVNLAATLAASFGAEWHSHEELRGIFAAAIAQRLAKIKLSPKGALALASQLQQAPDALGAVIERADAHAHFYQHLAAGPTTLLDVSRKKEEEKKKGGKS
jgi:hypothetical protein